MCTYTITKTYLILLFTKISLFIDRKHNERGVDVNTVVKLIHDTSHRVKHEFHRHRKLIFLSLLLHYWKFCNLLGVKSRPVIVNAVCS